MAAHKDHKPPKGMHKMPSGKMMSDKEHKKEYGKASKKGK